MFTLPLFPLHTVLFPGMPVHLHVFEPRYQRMMEACLSSNREFGAVLIQSGEEALGPLPEPYQVGCVARITESIPLSQGRMNLVGVGKERFRIHSLDRQSEPYLVGRVEEYPLLVENLDGLQESALRLRSRLERYHHLLLRVVDALGEPEPLPDETVAMAYMAASLLQVPVQEKQAFLEILGAAELFTSLESAFDRELPLLRAMLGESSRDGIGIFSRN